MNFGKMGRKRKKGFNWVLFGKIGKMRGFRKIRKRKLMINALSTPRPPPVHSPSMLRPCLGYEGNPKKCCLISEGFGFNHYSLFGGFPDGAGFPLQSFLRQKRISAPIPNPRRLRGLREEAEWESLTRNFW